jgi:hypothetical protein
VFQGRGRDEQVERTVGDRRLTDAEIATDTRGAPADAPRDRKERNRADEAVEGSLVGPGVTAAVDAFEVLRLGENAYREPSRGEWPDQVDRRLVAVEPIHDQIGVDQVLHRLA